MISFMPDDTSDTLNEIARDDDEPATSDVPEPPGGGLVDESQVINENTDGPEAGDMGHWGVDEGTE